MNGWQPIETAPKVGYVLLFPGRWNGITCDIGTWNEDKYAKKPKPFWRRLSAHTVGDSRDYPPTHWMPLPAPPCA